MSEEQYKKILDLIESGKKDGAKLECGGGVLGNVGYFVQPTVFSGVNEDMRIGKEEVGQPFLPCILILTLSQTTNFRPFQTERVCTRQ